jgi:hypothetical protein
MRSPLQRRHVIDAAHEKVVVAAAGADVPEASEAAVAHQALQLAIDGRAVADDGIKLMETVSMPRMSASAHEGERKRGVDLGCSEHVFELCASREEFFVQQFNGATDGIFCSRGRNGSGAWHRRGCRCRIALWLEAEISLHGI